MLDPVAVGAGSVAYDETIRSLLAFKPAVIRGNASELISLAGGAASGKGVETQARSIEAVPHIMRLAQQTGAVVAVSGATDYVTDGGEVVAIGGGDARLTHVTGAAAASVR
ncbi:hydroxyethylthiazole kinase-like sugar kinase family protein [Paraburkholderia youngii]